MMYGILRRKQAGVQKNKQKNRTELSHQKKTKRTMQAKDEDCIKSPK
jgi:hypothetical protein